MIQNCNKIDGCKYIIRTNTGESAIKEIAELPDKEFDGEMNFLVTTSSKYYVDNHKTNPYLHCVRHAKKHYKEKRSVSTKQRDWDHNWLERIRCRVVKFKIKDEDGKDAWEVLLTNLDRFEFPLSRMKDMYHMRWDIETSFRELKYALGAISFHSKKDEFVLMELFAHFIMFNAVSRAIAKTSVAGKDLKYSYTVQFKMACKITRKYFRLHSKEPPDMIYIEFGFYLIPIRPGRKDKRKLGSKKNPLWFVYRVA